MAENVTVHHRLGRRGAYLLTGGIVWWCQAILIYRHHQPVPSYAFLSHCWQLRAAGWAICGTIAAWAAFRRQGRDAPGWVALYAMSAWIVLAIGDGIVESLLHGGATFDLFLNGGINFGIVAWVAIASGWREPVTISITDQDEAS